MPSRVRTQAAFVLKGKGVWGLLRFLVSASFPLGAVHLSHITTFLQTSNTTDVTFCSAACPLYMNRKVLHI